MSASTNTGSGTATGSSSDRFSILTLVYTVASVITDPLVQFGLCIIESLSDLVNLFLGDRFVKLVYLQEEGGLDVTLLHLKRIFYVTMGVSALFAFGSVIFFLIALCSSWALKMSLVLFVGTIMALVVTSYVAKLVFARAQTAE